jgi:dihydrofolate reductase
MAPRSTSNTSPRGLVDEIRIHLVNVLLGGGRPLFDQLPRQFELEQTGVTETHGVKRISSTTLAGSAFRG